MKLKILILVFLGFMSIKTFAQTAGTATFTVTTASNGGYFNPENVVAIWIKNSSGTFVRSMKVMAAQRISYLYQWKVSSSLNTVGAVTGATLSSHQTHVIAWNCTDQGGTLLADGDYSFWVEYSADNAQGPYSSFTFTKSSSAQYQTFPNETGFINISLDYIPDAISIEEGNQQAKTNNILGSNFVSFMIPSQIEENAFLQIYSINGQKIFETSSYFDDGKQRYFVWNTYNESNGIYLYRIESGAKTYKGKLFR